jgi:hypothetical protein
MNPESGITFEDFSSTKIFTDIDTDWTEPNNQIELREEYPRMAELFFQEANSAATNATSILDVQTALAKKFNTLTTQIIEHGITGSETARNVLISERSKTLLNRLNVQLVSLKILYLERVKDYSDSGEIRREQLDRYARARLFCNRVKATIFQKYRWMIRGDSYGFETTEEYEASVNRTRRKLFAGMSVNKIDVIEEYFLEQWFPELDRELKDFEI